MSYTEHRDEEEQPVMVVELGTPEPRVEEPPPDVIRNLVREVDRLRSYGAEQRAQKWIYVVGMLLWFSLFIWSAIDSSKPCDSPSSAPDGDWGSTGGVE